MFAIYKKELRNYFTTPLGYAFIAVFLAVSGFIFSVATFQSQSSDMSGYCQIMIFGYIVIVPMLTMRSFAEERRTRTEQILLTSPVSITSMILAKFFAAMTMFASSVLASCLYFIPLFKYGEPNIGKAVGCLIAMLLLGTAFIAVGIFVSTLTESAVTACVGTIGILLLFAGFSLFNGLIDSYAVRSVLNWLSIYSRYSAFTYGMFDVAAAVYYVSISAIFLFLAVRVYERRRYA